MSGGQDQAAEQLNTMPWIEKEINSFSELRHRMASLQVEQSCLRARVESLEGREGRAQERPAELIVEKLELGPAVQFQRNGCWKVGYLVVFADDPNGYPASQGHGQVVVACLDGLWLVPTSMLTKKPLRND